MVICQNCGAEVVGSDFCFSCGEKVEKFELDSDICPKCGTKNDKNTTFCRECGHKLANGASVSFKQQEWNARRDEVLARYDKLAEEFGIKDEDYFLTSVKRYNKLEQFTNKHKTTTFIGDVTSAGLSLNKARDHFFGNETKKQCLLRPGQNGARKRALADKARFRSIFT